jgi:hypothetical protein
MPLFILFNKWFWNIMLLLRGIVEAKIHYLPSWSLYIADAGRE